MGTHRKSETINFRTTAMEREIIRRAAESTNVTESEYARNSALKQAEMDIADQTVFSVSEEVLAGFALALEKPALIKPNLKKLLKEKSVLE